MAAAPAPHLPCPSHSSPSSSSGALTALLLLGSGSHLPRHLHGSHTPLHESLGSSFLFFFLDTTSAPTAPLPLRRLGRGRFPLDLEEIDDLRPDQQELLGILALAAAADLADEVVLLVQEGKSKSPAGMRGRMGRRQKMWRPQSQPPHSSSSSATSPDPHISHLKSSFVALCLAGHRARIRQRCCVARDTDVFLATFPKSGTTWLKALLYAALRRTAPTSSPLSSRPRSSPTTRSST